MKYTTEQKLRFMAELKRAIENAPPCYPGDHVHIHMREGCYKVISIFRYGFSVVLKRNLTFLTWSQFKHLKGNGSSDETKAKRAVRQLLRGA